MRASYNKRRVRAFTLVELMVVIFIIGLLVSILLPSLAAAMRSGNSAKTQAIVNMLSSGCNQYKNDHRVFPGQGPYAARLTGSSPAGPYTGSQYLAIAMFSDPYNPTTTNLTLSTYGQYNANLLFTDGALANTISDGFSDRMPVLYYPSRGESRTTNATTGAFRYADNSAHTTSARVTGTAVTGFQSAITDSKFGASGSNNIAYHYDSFVLIGAGPDRLYFTSDDIKQ
jgi:general secretion pathway protein G